MTYYTFTVSIESANLTLKFIDVVACDTASAIADVKEAYGADLHIVATCQK